MSEENDKKDEKTAAAPVRRERKPALKTKSSTARGSQSEDTHERQSKLQKAAVEQHQKNLTEVQKRTLALTTPTKLSTEGFVGKAHGEPHKDPEEELNKIGVNVAGEDEENQALAYPKEFKTIPQEENGMVVDRIVITETLEDEGLPGATPLTEPQKVQKVIDEHSGKKNKKK